MPLTKFISCYYIFLNKIIIIDDLSTSKKDAKINSRNSERTVRQRKNSNKIPNDELVNILNNILKKAIAYSIIRETANDEILARQLQEEFDHEYATSLDNNLDINSDPTRNIENSNEQNVEISENLQNNFLNDVNDQALLFAQRRTDNNNSGLRDEFNFLQNDNFVSYLNVTAKIFFLN